jgi:formylglycine-generating enzyme
VERSWWPRALVLTSVLGCAKLVGFEDEYYLVSSGARGGQAGDGGSPSDGGAGDGSGADMGGAPGGESGASGSGGGAGNAGRSGGDANSGGRNGGRSGEAGASGAGEGGDSGSGNSGGSSGGSAGGGTAGGGTAGGGTAGASGLGGNGGSGGSESGGAGNGGAGNGGAGNGGAGNGGAGNGGAGNGGGGTTGGSGATGGAGTAGDTGGGGAAGDSGGGGSGGAGGGGEGGGGGQPSCRGLALTCGATGDGDCCASSVVPGGEFARLNDAAYPATISAFALDLYEVSVGRFRKFVAQYPDNKPAEGAGKNPNDPLDPGWDGAAWNDTLPASVLELEAELNCEPALLVPTWTHDPGPHESRPINCVTWQVAFAFCIWDGGRLPTQAESNFAAAGGDEQRLYPWSDSPDDDFITPDHASYLLLNTPDNCWGDNHVGCTIEDFVFVGSKPLGNARWGQADMAGNVWEWTRDAGTLPAECDDCANLDTTGPRVARGGGYISGAHLLRVEAHLSFPVEPTSTALGIRCARALPPP